MFKALLREKYPYSEFSDPYFPAFVLNSERYRVSFRIQSEFRKIRTRKTPNTDTFHIVHCIRIERLVAQTLLVARLGLTSS